jgi:hypothetical protein
LRAPAIQWDLRSDLAKLGAFAGPIIMFLAIVLAFVTCFYRSSKNPKGLEGAEDKTVRVGPMLGVGIGTLAPWDNAVFEVRTRTLCLALADSGRMFMLCMLSCLSRIITHYHVLAFWRTVQCV